MKKIVKTYIEFCDALKTVNDGDVIELCPGEYFRAENTPYLKVEKNITITGQFSNPEATRLNCGLLLINHTLILKNLSLNYDSEEGNAVSLYRDAKFYGDNVVINHQTANKWNTIFAQDSFISLKKSEILNCNKDNIPGLMLENSQIYAVDTALYFIAMKKSTSYLKDCFVSYAVCLLNKSSLDFNDLTIDSNNNEMFTDFYVDQQSTVEGDEINFIKTEPMIEVFDSQCEINDFESEFENIHWHFDDNSNVLADGREPFNIED